MLQLLKAFLTSKKAAALIGGILTVLLREFAGLDDATIELIVNLILGYFVSQGAVDVALALRGFKTPK